MARTLRGELLRLSDGICVRRHDGGRSRAHGQGSARRKHASWGPKLEAVHGRLRAYDALCARGGESLLHVGRPARRPGGAVQYLTS